MRFDFLHIIHVNFTPSPQLQYPVCNVMIPTIEALFRTLFGPITSQLLLFCTETSAYGVSRGKTHKQAPRKCEQRHFIVIDFLSVPQLNSGRILTRHNTRHSHILFNQTGPPPNISSRQCLLGRKKGKPEQVLVDMQNPRAEGRHVSLYTVTLDNVPPLFPQCPSPSLLDLPSCHLLVTNIHCVDVTAGTFQICESRFTL